MAKLRIAAVAALGLVAVCVAVAVAAAKREPVLTARVVGIANVPGGFSVTLQMTNGTDCVYHLHGAQLEIASDAGWKKRSGTWVFLDQANFNRVNISARTSKTFTIVAFTSSQFKQDERLRIVFRAGTLRSGLSAFPFRVKQWILHRQGSFSLNPFWGSTWSFPDTLLTTEAFTTP